MLFLREANSDDTGLVMSWHSNPVIFSGFYTIRSPLTWEEHYYWWTETTKTWKKFMVVLVENNIPRTIGIVRISALEDFSPQTALTIGEISLWGKGYGKKALELGLQWLRDKGKKHTHTSIPDHNLRCIALYKGLGFERYGEAREGESWYQRKL